MVNASALNLNYEKLNKPVEIVIEGNDIMAPINWQIFKILTTLKNLDVIMYFVDYDLV